MEVVDVARISVRFAEGRVSRVRRSGAWSALDALREADKTIQALVANHRTKVVSGEIVSFPPIAVNISESINRPLRNEFESFLNPGARAMKGMQTVLEPFGLAIGPLFQKQGAFDGGIADLEKAGHVAFAAYLKAARSAWTEQFFERRNQMEHAGWQLNDVNYPLIEGKVAMVEPVVDGVVVTEYTAHMTRRILTFVEETLAYGFALCLPHPVILVEERLVTRDPDHALRFRVHMMGQGLPQWEIKYDDEGFH